GIVAARCDSAWLRRKEDRSSLHRDSARRISILRTQLSTPQSRGRMAIRASWPFDRQERSAGHAPRVREFSASLSRRNANDCRRRSIARSTSRLGARTEDRQSRFVCRFHFAGAVARPLLWIAHFRASERNRRRREPGRNSKFNVGSNG